MTATQGNVNKHLKNELERSLINTLSDLKTPEHILLFLKDFLSDKEFDMLSKRLAIAYWLKKGRSSDNIQKNLKVSPKTISQVSELMDTKGMKLALKQLQAEEWANKWSERIKSVVRNNQPSLK